jgi:hypothetical protein
VEFEELLVILGKMIVGRIVDGRGDGAGQGGDGGFDYFVMCQLQWCFGAHKRIARVTCIGPGFKRSLKWTLSPAGEGC